MNKIFTCVCVLCLSLVIVFGSAFAGSYPTGKGSMLVDADFSFRYVGGDLYQNTTQIVLTSSGNYFLITGLGVGGILQLERTSVGSSTWTELGIGPQLMYIIGKNRRPRTIKGTVYPFVRTRLLFVKEWNSAPDWAGTIVNFGGGIIYMLTRSVGLVLALHNELHIFKHGTPQKTESGYRILITAGLTSFLY